MRRTLIFPSLLVFLVVTSPLLADDPSMPTDCSTTVVRVHSTDRAVIANVARWTEPWELRAEDGYFVVGVDDQGLKRLESMGVPLEIDAKRTADHCAPHFRLPGQVSGIPGFPCYRTVEETFATATQLVADYPTLAQFVDVGDSWEKTEPGGAEGYDMMVLTLTNSQVTGTPTGDGQGKPVFFITSAIHAREYTTAELTTRFAEYLLDNYGVDADATWLLDEHEIHLMLHANPDGRKHAENGESWRKNTNENYCSPTSSSRGADLNRNFSFQWGCCGGSSGDPCDNTYRGATAASEPEAQAVENYAASVFPDQRDDAPDDPAPDDATGLYFDIHSYSELILWPWGFDTENDPPNGPALQTLGRKLAYFNGYDPSHQIWYPVDGDTIDSTYGHLGVASYVFELGTTFFQDCESFESTIFPDNLEALIYAAKVPRTPYLTPSGPEVLDLNLQGGVFVAPGDPIEVAATADDTRFNNTSGTEPTGVVAAARCSLDTPPWADPTPDFYALAASDGTFDAGVEAVEQPIATTGLADGRHTLFCQAQDDDDQWGPVSALFFWIMDPATAPHIAGTVTSAGDGAPLEATITVGSISSGTSDPGTGAYDLMVPEGVYTVTAAPTGPEHGGHSVSDVVATTGSTTTLDFQLQPFEVSLFEDAEDGNSLGWTAQSPWALTTESAYSPTHSWTDSPGGNYGDYVDASLTSPLLDLSNVENVELRFFHTYATESGWDYAIVEYSTNGGSNWSESARWDGSNSGWDEVVLQLPDLDGAAQARVRFHLTTDVNTTDDGWHVDDITVRGTLVEPPLFANGFESGDNSGWDVATP